MTAWYFEIPKSLEDEPDIVSECRRMALDDIYRTISMSEIRCLPFEELLKRVEHLSDDPQAGEIVYRVCEEEFSDKQLHLLATTIQRLAVAVDHLPSAQKSSVDRAIKRMLASMPASIAAPMAERWLDHKRKFRRQIAYRVLRECGLTAVSGPRLLEVFNRTADQECLKLIARYPVALRDLGVPSLLEKVDDDYWRMRMVQAAVVADKPKAMALADSYPLEFLHAIGRLKDATLQPDMLVLFEKHSDDLKFLSLYAWVLGQLAARPELIELKVHVEKLRQQPANPIR